MSSVQSSGGFQQSPKSGSMSDPSLTRRRHGIGLRDLGETEWFAHLGPSDNRWYVPLGTADPTEAVRNARSTSAELLLKGWDRAGTSIPREFTLAIAWLEAPLAWTYVSLFTLPKHSATGSLPVASNRTQIAVVEPDPVFRNAICHWLGRIPGVSCQGWAAEPPHLSPVRRRPDFDILLINRLMPSFMTGRLQSGKGSVAGNLLVFGYGIYPTSDDVFAAVSGVDAGYYLRRRTLSTVLEPLEAAFSGGQLASAEVPRSLRRYFQNVFNADTEGSNAGGLTIRERQILACIQRGLRDKEIATSLGISPLTVHTHLKHVFHKLGAHTRTEAVVKYLEK